MTDILDDDMSFPNDEINDLVMNIITSVLETAVWDEKKVPHWINKICEETIEKLIDAKYPYKFIVNCMLVQKTEKPLFSCCSFRLFL